MKHPKNQFENVEVDEYASEPAETYVPGHSTVRSDSYKMSVERFPKNVANDGERPNFVGMEHSHIFHTHDQRGRIQEYSCPIGGHFHRMKVTPDPRGKEFPPIVACVSGPLKWVNVKDKYGGNSRKAVPAYTNLDGAEDRDFVDAEHKHKVKYIGTSQLKSAAANPEAAKLMGMMAPPPAPPDVKV